MPEIERRFTLHVPSSAENLALIRDFVSNIGNQAGLDESEVAKLVLAVDEACANVIEHAYGKDISKEVSVRVRVDEDAITIEVHDTGKGFDPARIEQEGLEKLVHDRRSGGLGMRMIKMLMDEVVYQIVPGEKNELRMVKRLKRNA
jgi:serine/threonine-protein kinase RsbW